MAIVSGCNRGEPLAAAVNGEGITMNTYYQQLHMMPNVQVLVDPSRLQTMGGGQIPRQPYTGQVVGSLGLQALNQLVHQTLLRQLAKDEGVYPTDADVESELKDRQKENPAYMKQLTQAGFSLAQIRNDVALNLAEFNLTTKGIKVSDQEVDTYIKQHPKEFVRPEQIQMLWILAPDEKTKAAADSELKAGQPFIVVAQKYSRAPNARQMQYAFPQSSVTALAQLGPDLLPAVKKTPELGQTDWIRFTDGFAKFYINKKVAPENIRIDDLIKKKVRQSMMIQKGSQGKDVPSRIDEKLRSAKIQIMVEHLRDPWEKSMESLGGNASTAAAPTTPTTNDQK